MTKTTSVKAPPALPPLRGYAWLPKGTLLYPSAELTGPGFALGVLRPGDPIWQEVARGLVKVLDERAGAVQVEVVPREETACGRREGLSGPLRIWGFVRRDALGEVVETPPEPPPCKDPKDIRLSDLPVIGISEVNPCGPEGAKTRPDLEVPMGTRLSWLDRSEAGVTAEPMVFRCRQSHPADDAKRTCQEMHAPGYAGVLTLCFERAAPSPPKAGSKDEAEVEVSSRRKGSLSKETIRRGIHHDINEIRACYETILLPAQPRFGLRWKVRFVIGPKGRVTSAEMIESADSTETTDACVLQAVRAFTFPPPDGGGEVIVTYPFIVDVAGG